MKTCFSTGVTRTYIFHEHVNSPDLPRLVSRLSRWDETLNCRRLKKRYSGDSLIVESQANVKISPSRSRSLKSKPQSSPSPSPSIHPANPTRSRCTRKQSPPTDLRHKLHFHENQNPKTENLNLYFISLAQKVQSDTYPSILSFSFSRSCALCM